MIIINVSAIGPRRLPYCFIRVFLYLVWVIGFSCSWFLWIITMVRIMSMVTRVRASFGYRLDVIRHSKSIAGKCDKIFLAFWSLGILLDILWFLLLGLSFLSSFLLRRQGLWAVFHYNGSQVVLVGFWPFPGPPSWRAYGVPWAYNILQGNLYSNMLYIRLIE